MALTLVQNGLRKQGRETSLAFIMVEHGAGTKTPLHWQGIAWFEYHKSFKGVGTRHFYQSVQVWGTRERERVRLKSCQQPNISKCNRTSQPYSTLNAFILSFTKIHATSIRILEAGFHKPPNPCLELRPFRDQASGTIHKVTGYDYLHQGLTHLYNILTNCHFNNEKYF